MKKIAIAIAAVCAMVIGAGGDVKASIVGGALKGYTINTLVDESRGLFIDEDGDGVVSVGDYINGVISFRDIGPVGNTTNTNRKVFGIYALEIIGIDGATITAGAISDTSNANENSLNNILSNSNIVANGLSTGANSTLALIESNDGTEVALGSLDVTSGFVSGGAVGGLLGSSFTNVLVGGIKSNSDYYAITLDGSNPLGAGKSVTNLADLAAGAPLSADKEFASYDLGFTVEAHAFGSDVTFSKLGNSNGVGTSDIVTAGNNSILALTAGVNSDKGWHFADDGDFYVRPVPEPSTIAIWAALGLGGCGLVARRRMKAKKA